jgi:hypothetical protein
MKKGKGKREEGRESMLSTVLHNDMLRLITWTLEYRFHPLHHRHPLPCSRSRPNLMHPPTLFDLHGEKMSEAAGRKRSVSDPVASLNVPCHWCISRT